MKHFIAQQPMQFLRLCLLSAVFIHLTGCSSFPGSSRTDSATVARRQAAWAGTHQLHAVHRQHGGKNEVSMMLTLSPTTPPVFRSWSESETRVTPFSSVRRVATIPGEVAEYQSSDLSGGIENPQRQSRNTLIKASFDRDYTTLTLFYRDSAFDGLLKRSFRLDESVDPPVVVGDEGSVYTRLP